MSVIVKNMKMPKECGKCRFKRLSQEWGKDYICNCPGTFDKGIDAYIKNHFRPSWCRLMGLPEKHGRLIDADALIAKCGDWYTEEGKEEGFIGTLEMLLKDAPTVVEAEGE